MFILTRQQLDVQPRPIKNMTIATSALGRTVTTTGNGETPERVNATNVFHQIFQFPSVLGFGILDNGWPMTCCMSHFGVSEKINPFRNESTYPKDRRCVENEFVDRLTFQQKQKSLFLRLSSPDWLLNHLKLFRYLMLGSRWVGEGGRLNQEEKSHMIPFSYFDI